MLLMNCDIGVNNKSYIMKLHNLVKMHIKIIHLDVSSGTDAEQDVKLNNFMKLLKMNFSV